MRRTDELPPLREKIFGGEGKKISWANIKIDKCLVPWLNGMCRAVTGGGGRSSMPQSDRVCVPGAGADY